MALTPEEEARIARLEMEIEAARPHLLTVAAVLRDARSGTTLAQEGGSLYLGAGGELRLTQGLRLRSDLSYERLGSGNAWEIRLLPTGESAPPGLLVSLDEAGSAGGAFAADYEAKIGLARAHAAPTFATGWADFDASLAVEYRKDELGMVRLRGLAKKSAALAVPETICTLPAGFRPIRTHIFAMASQAGYAEVRVTSAGVVSLQSGGSASWTSLDGVAFWEAQESLF